MSKNRSKPDNNNNESINKTQISEEIVTSEETLADTLKETPEDTLEETSVELSEELTAEASSDTSEDDIHTADSNQADDDNTTSYEATKINIIENIRRLIYKKADKQSDTAPITDEEPITTNKKPKIKIYKALRILCTIGFVIFLALFINEVVIQHIRIKNSIDLTRELYIRPIEGLTITPSPTQVPVDDVILASAPDVILASAPVVTEAPPPATITPIPTVAAATPTPDPNRDAQGRLLQFKDLLAVNDDVKGWITIPDTNIDYVVMQSGADNPNYYLHKDINKEYSKAGTLFLDARSSIERNAQNLVIYGHNMISTPEKMFHYLKKYKDGTKYYKNHPLLTFDTIYETGVWKIFAVFITPPDPANKDFFEFRKSHFLDSSDFLNFVYQIRIRSKLNVDAVDINEDDQLLMLSTCSYEVNDDYRTVIVARKVRDGEAQNVDLDSVTVNKKPLYADDYYSSYGGKAPELAATFEEALANGDINWYTPSTDNVAE